MAEITFIIDDQTGAMTVDIAGVVGPACENIEKMIAALTGNAATTEKKPSYYQRVVGRQTVGGK